LSLLARGKSILSCFEEDARRRSEQIRVIRCFRIRISFFDLRGRERKSKRKGRSEERPSERHDASAIAALASATAHSASTATALSTTTATTLASATLPAAALTGTLSAATAAALAAAALTRPLPAATTATSLTTAAHSTTTAAAAALLTAATTLTTAALTAAAALAATTTLTTLVLAAQSFARCAIALVADVFLIEAALRPRCAEPALRTSRGPALSSLSTLRVEVLVLVPFAIRHGRVLLAESRASCHGASGAAWERDVGQRVCHVVGRLPKSFVRTRLTRVTAKPTLRASMTETMARFSLSCACTCRDSRA
jgi:hypothetical protein